MLILMKGVYAMQWRRLTLRALRKQDTKSTISLCAGFDSIWYYAAAITVPSLLNLTYRSSRYCFAGVSILS